MSDSIKTITKRSSIIFIGKIFDSVLMFIFNLIAARFLSAKNYGTYVYIFTFVMLFSILVKIGMDQGLSGILPKYKNKEIEKNVVSFSIVFIYLVSIIVIIIGITFSDFISKNMLNNIEFKAYLIRFIPLLLFLPLTQLSEGIFRTIGGVRHYVIAKNIIVPVTIVIALLFQIFILGQKNVYTLLYSNYFAWALSVIYIFVILCKKGYIEKPSLKYKEIYKKLILLSLPLVFVGLLNYLIGRIDSYMLGYMVDETSVGIYNIADKIAYISSFLFVAVSSMFAPEITKTYHEKDFKKLEKLYKQLTRWILIINVCIFFMILLNSSDILNVFGEEYKRGNTTLILLSFAYLINASAGAIVYMNAMTGKGKNEFYISSSMLLTNMLLNYILINIYGIDGAAISTIVVFFIGVVARLIIVNKNLHIVPFSTKYFIVFLNGISAFIPTYYLSKIIIINNYILRIFIYSIIYGILYFVLTYLFSTERDEKTQILYKIKCLKRGDKNGTK